MSLGPAETAIKARAASFTALPLRWQNESFDGVSLDQNGLPIDADGAPVAWVLGEIIGGRNRQRSFGLPGHRQMIHPGLIRFYVSVPQGQTSDGAAEQADALGALFELANFSAVDGTEVHCLEASSNDGVAAYEDGSYFVLTVSIPFDFFYFA